MKAVVGLLLVSRVAFGAIALDVSGSTINGANSTTCVTPSKTTTGGSGELMVVMLQSEATDANPTISDTSSLSWTRLAVANQGSSPVFTEALWYATTSGNLTSWTATVTTANAGLTCAVWAFTGAGTPKSWTTATTNSPALPGCTITAGTGSYLVGIASDATTGGALTADGNTTVTLQGSGAAADWFMSWRTTSTVTGSTTFGFSTGSGDTYAGACAEIPATGGGGGSTHTLSILGVGP